MAQCIKVVTGKLVSLNLSPRTWWRKRSEAHVHCGTVAGTYRHEINKQPWAGEPAQWMRTLSTLPENPGSIPSTHTAANNCNFNSRAPDTFAQTYQAGKTPMYNNNKKLKKPSRHGGRYLKSQVCWGWKQRETFNKLKKNVLEK